MTKHVDQPHTCTRMCLGSEPSKSCILMHVCWGRELWLQAYTLMNTGIIKNQKINLKKENEKENNQKRILVIIIKIKR